jgi:hypothetical protein
MWSKVQVKIEKAQQKIKGLLNVFGAYDYTNDKLHVHCYRNKTAKQFIGFLKKRAFPPRLTSKLLYEGQ